VLRIGVVVAVLVLVVALGYGYFRYEWAKVSSSPCSACVSVPSGQPYNVLLIGSDSRAGETPEEALHFGSATSAGGQRSDTIKIVRVDPSAGTATSLSIPRDTYVTLSGMPASSPLSSDNKINAAFGAGPDALIKTIQNTFGIPISHYIVVSFFGLQNAVDALGGISMDFPYPVRDQDCSSGVCNNNSGLDIPTTSCQVLNGAQALALSRSRYFEYQVDGRWVADPTGDLGRIQRQNLIISAALNKAKSTYNPFTLNALFTSLVHDFSKDDGLGANDMLSLAEHYHAFSGSQLAAYTMPTTGASSSVGSVEVVEPHQAAVLLDQFLGGDRPTIVTPPLDADGAPLSLPVTTTTTAPAAPSSGAAPAAPAAPTIPSYDPRPC
jgi:LCP family protein required for cell wall assembly